MGSTDSVSVGEPGSEAATASASEWDPNTWKAKIKITPRYTMEEEKLAFRAQWLKRDAEFLEIEAPSDVPLVEWQESLELMERVQWDYWNEYYIPCLVAHGLTVDISERPARETYVANFNTDPERRWWPDNGGSLLLQIPPEVWKACPNIPPASELYGLE